MLRRILISVSGALALIIPCVLYLRPDPPPSGLLPSRALLRSPSAPVLRIYPVADLLEDSLALQAALAPDSRSARPPAAAVRGSLDPTPQEVARDRLLLVLRSAAGGDWPDPLNARFFGDDLVVNEPESVQSAIAAALELLRRSR